MAVRPPRGGRRWLLALAAAAAPLVATGQTAAPTAAAGPAAFTVCVAADNAPLSRASGRGADARIEGLDVRIAEAAAQALGRPLKLVPFETDYEKETSLVHEVGALLAAGICDAVSGFPLQAGDIGAPSRASARAPDYPGAARRRERPYTVLQPTAATRPYIGSALGLVSRTDLGGDAPASLQELAQRPLDSPGNARLGITVGTLAGTYGQLWRHGTLKPRLVTLAQREEVLDQLAQPAAPFGHALVPLLRYDGWRLAHPQAPVVASAWRKPLGLNLGFLLNATRSTEREALDRTIAAALADGRLAAWARSAGVSWTPPTEPAIASGFSLAALLAD